MLNLDKIAELNEQLEDELEDLTNPVVSTGRPLPEAGVTRLRLVRYVELGKHRAEYAARGNQKARTTEKSKVELTFELSGPKHPPMEFDGVKVPHLIKIKVDKGITTKNGYIKLFKAMTSDGNPAKNFLAMVGQAFRGTVIHREFDKADGTKGKVAKLQDDNGFTISPATYEDLETGEKKVLPVDAPITPLAVFLFDRPDLDQWDSIYIDGEWDNGDVKNEDQERIKRALDFEGSAIQLLLAEQRPDELELQQFNSGKKAAADPLGEAEPTEAEKAVEAAGKKKAQEAAQKAAAAIKNAGEGKGTGKAKKAPVAPPAEPEEELREQVAEPEAAADEEEDDDAAAFAAFKAAQAAKKAAAKGKGKAVDPLAGL